MGSRDVREPIPNGFVKLVGFIVLVAGATFLAWRYVGEAWAAVVLIGFFTAVRLVHPQGWTNWIREFWFWDVRGVMECFQEKEHGEIDRWLEPYFYESPPNKDFAIYSGSWGIRIKRSGWSLRKGWIMKRWHTVGREFWSVGRPKFGSCLWEVAGEFSNPTSMVRLTQRDGSCMDLSVKQAFDVLHTLTVFDSEDCKIESVRPFRDLLPAMASTTDTVAPSNGTA